MLQCAHRYSRGDMQRFFGSGGGMIAVPMLEKGGSEAKKAHATSIAITLPLSIISGLVYFKGGSLDFLRQ